MIFLILLLLAFFIYLNISDDSPEFFAPLRLEEKLSINRDGQSFSHYGEFKDSDSKNDNNSDENANRSTNYTNDSAAEDKIVADNTEKELPALLEIPSIGVSAKVQQVGLNSKKEMDVPSNEVDVAWYNLGPKPGETGSAVIAGHLDNRASQPAVFWNLDRMAVGDYIYVTDGSNNKKSFQVISSERYKTGDAPMEKIFGVSNGAYLNLVTCGGVWDKEKNNYSERFVVFTEYVSS